MEERKVAIVTGGATGIGKAIAKMLARKRITVVVDYNKTKATQLQEELREEGIEVDVFRADVSDEKQVKELVDYTLKKYKRIDILVNNAGISHYALITDTTSEEWHKVMDTNVFSAFAMIREIADAMIYKKSGCIINISSVWGKLGASVESTYSTSKGALDALTKSMAKELGPSNIRVNSIAPGMIDTRMNEDWTEEELNLIKERIPLGKIGKPEAIAKCAEWLIEDDYTTGQVISVDGGWSISN